METPEKVPVKIMFLAVLVISLTALLTLPDSNRDDRDRKENIHFSFDEGEGGLARAEESDRRLTVAGPLWVDGRSGKALRFYEDMSAYSREINLALREANISFWIKPGPEKSEGAVFSSLGRFEESEPEISEGWVWYYINAPSSDEGLTYRDGDVRLESSEVNWSQDRWYHVRIGHSPETNSSNHYRRKSTLYIDGDRVDRDLSATPPVFRFSKIWLGESDFSGSIDEFRISGYHLEPGV